MENASRSHEKKVLQCLRLLSVDGWVLNTSFPEIARLSGVGLRSVPRHLDRLEEKGAVKIHRERGRGRRNSYEIKEPPHDR